MIVDIPPRVDAGDIPPSRPESNGMGTAGFVCGLLGVVIGLLLSIALGMVLSVLGIVFGSVGQRRSGVVLGTVGLVLCGLTWLAVA